ncbi:MAG: hypothetical protein H0V17_21775 [Deltaproteobacteria bacterium]|nr:hypothetical protein [Deltaproteobacteria bacterium]
MRAKVASAGREQFRDARAGHRPTEQAIELILIALGEDLVAFSGLWVELARGEDGDHRLGSAFRLALRFAFRLAFRFAFRKRSALRLAEKLFGLGVHLERLSCSFAQRGFDECRI